MRAGRMDRIVTLYENDGGGRSGGIGRQDHRCRGFIVEAIPDSHGV